MIYEIRPDTVEAVYYSIVDGEKHFSATPYWMKNILNSVDYEGDEFSFWDGLEYVYVVPENWIVRFESEYIAIYDDETFIRKFKKVA